MRTRQNANANGVGTRKRFVFGRPVTLIVVTNTLTIVNCVTKPRERYASACSPRDTSTFMPSAAEEPKNQAKPRICKPVKYVAKAKTPLSGVHIKHCAATVTHSFQLSSRISFKSARCAANNM